MSLQTVPMIRTADLSHQAIKLNITDQKAMDNLRAYVEMMAQQRKPLTTIKVARDFHSGVMRALNKGRQADEVYSGATFKGIPLEVVNG